MYSDQPACLSVREHISVTAGSPGMYDMGTLEVLTLYIRSFHSTQ